MVTAAQILSTEFPRWHKIKKDMKMNDNISKQMAEANGKPTVLPPELTPVQTPEDVGEETPETTVKQ